MSTAEIREPIQKRSIEKKEKIIKSGFELICKDGYHNTDTSKIAKKAGVSTGIIYQYFKDINSYYNLLNILKIKASLTSLSALKSSFIYLYYTLFLISVLQPLYSHKIEVIKTY